MKKKAVVLVSGGLDSAVTLFYAIDKGYSCLALTLDYGQRNSAELRCASRIAERSGAEHKLIRLRLGWKGSSLLDKKERLPLDRDPAKIRRSGIPTTYVPARNTVFLSLALSCAEAIGAESVFIGTHADDSSGYPDCRKTYLDAFDSVARLGTKKGLEGGLRLEYPLVCMNKAQIITLGRRLNVPFEMTRSCYTAGPDICGRCDSCVLRAKGFLEAGFSDPLICRARREELRECIR